MFFLKYPSLAPVNMAYFVLRGHERVMPYPFQFSIHTLSITHYIPMQLNKPRSKQSPLWSRCSTFQKKNFEKDISSFIRATCPTISSKAGSSEHESIQITNIHTCTPIRTYIHKYVVRAYV